MLKMTVQSDAHLLKERDRLQSVLQDTLGRAPKGCLMNSLAAKIWKQPNFETAIAMAKRNGGKLDLSVLASEALASIGLESHVDSLSGLINSSVLSMSERAFNVPSEEFSHKVMLIAIYHYIHEKYKNMVISQSVKYVEKLWLDHQFLNLACNASGYDFYRGLDDSTTSIARIAGGWFERGYIHANCAIVAMVNYEAFNYLKNALGEHSCIRVGVYYFDKVSPDIYEQCFLKGKQREFDELIENKDQAGSLDMLANHIFNLISDHSEAIADQFSVTVTNDQLEVVRETNGADLDLRGVIIVKAIKGGFFTIDSYIATVIEGKEQEKHTKVGRLDDVSNAYYPWVNICSIVGSLKALIGSRLK